VWGIYSLPQFATNRVDRISGPMVGAPHLSRC
jgi:hypothetical protein